MADSQTDDVVEGGTELVVERLYVGKTCSCGAGAISELAPWARDPRNAPRRYGCTAGCHRSFSLQRPQGFNGRMHAVYRRVEWNGDVVRCGWKHDWAWMGRRIGRRLDLFCRALYEDDGGTLVVCAGRRTVYLGEKYGFENGGIPPNNNETKAWVLCAFADDEWHTARQVADAVPLTRGQVSGCIARSAKRGFLERFDEMVYEPPSSKSWAYRITNKGQLWIAWARKVGLVGEDDSNE